MDKNVRTPRCLSEASFHVGYPSMRQRGQRFNFWPWAGWIAFVSLLFVQLAGK